MKAGYCSGFLKNNHVEVRIEYEFSGTFSSTYIDIYQFYNEPCHTSNFISVDVFGSLGYITFVMSIDQLSVTVSPHLCVSES